MATKSLLRSPKKLDVDVVLQAHDCQGNRRHRLTKGEKRLKVFNASGRSPDHYCLACAEKIIRGDIERLNGLLGKLSS